jgi:hypothetical protein
MRIQKLLSKIISVGIVVAAVTPLNVGATTTLTPRNVTLGSSAASAATTYTATFTTSANETIKSVKFELCDSPLEGAACTQPAAGSVLAAGLNTGGPTSSEFSAFAAGTGGQAATATTFWITESVTGATVTNGGSYTIQLTNVTNPSSANYSYYVRVTTYANANGTGQNEFGAVAVSTANQITVTGNMPESLIFCVGITISTDCSTIGGGTTVDFGTFSPLTTSTGTSVMQASTNADSGYVITINGTTMTSGSNNIPAMGTQSTNSTGCSPSCTSLTGTSQFGTNVRDNATPNVGTDVSGVGTAVGQGGYNTADSFRFFTGDTVAGVGGPSKANTFTNSYIVNVGGDQAAGQYTATMTYICTATF